MVHDEENGHVGEGDSSEESRSPLAQMVEDLATVAIAAGSNGGVPPSTCSRWSAWPAWRLARATTSVRGLRTKMRSSRRGP